MIIEEILGRDASHFLNDEKDAQAIVDRMAEVLARLHTLDPKCIQESKVLQQQYEYVHRELLKLRFFIQKSAILIGSATIRQKRFVAAVKRLEMVRPRKFRPALLHMDYAPGHVLVSNGRCVVVDWGEAAVGDPAFDVAWMYHALRMEKKTNKVDLGEYFVKCYETYMGQNPVNLQFCKDMTALRMALCCNLSPFLPNNFVIFRKLVDFTFGNLVGRLVAPLNMDKLQRRLQRHHSTHGRSVEYYQDYVIQYLESARVTDLV